MERDTSADPTGPPLLSRRRHGNAPQAPRRTPGLEPDQLDRSHLRRRAQADPVDPGRGEGAQGGPAVPDHLRATFPARGEDRNYRAGRIENLDFHGRGTRGQETGDRNGSLEWIRGSEEQRRSDQPRFDHELLQLGSRLGDLAQIIEQSHAETVGSRGKVRLEVGDVGFHHDRQ